MKQETRTMLRGLGIATGKLARNYGDLALVTIGALVGDDLAQYGLGSRINIQEYSEHREVIDALFFYAPTIGGAVESAVSTYKSVRGRGTSRFNAAFAGAEAAGFRGLRNLVAHTMFDPPGYREINFTAAGLGLGITDGLRYGRPLSRLTTGIEKLVARVRRK